MRALQIDSLGTKASVRDVQSRPPGSGEATVRVESAFIGNRERNVTAFFEAADPASLQGLFPLTVGYRGAGVVERVGPDTGLSPGMPVFIHGYLPCRICEQCLAGASHRCIHPKVVGVDIDGCLAEYATLPAACLIPLRADLPLELAPAIADMGTAFHGIRRAGSIAGRHAAVVGGGEIGLAAAAILAVSGTASVTVFDPAPDARDRVARYLPDARALPAWPGGDDRYDIAFDASSVPIGVETAIKCLRPGGTAVIYNAMATGSAELRFDDFFREWIKPELTIVTTIAKTRDDLIACADLLATQPLLQALYSLEAIALDNAEDAFAEAMAGTMRGNILVRPHGN